MQSSALQSADEILINLVTAYISVNKWHVAKTARIHEGLADCGFFDLEVLRSLSVSDIEERMFQAGYTRPPYVVGLIAGRMHKFLQGFALADLARLRDAVTQGDGRAVDSQLLGLPGIGPSVLRTFKALQRVP